MTVRLTAAQRAWLMRLREQEDHSRDRVNMGDRAHPEIRFRIGDNFRTFERVMAVLVAHGLAEPYVHGGWVITRAGRETLERKED